jgi:hypothetical protein
MLLVLSYVEKNFLRSDNKIPVGLNSVLPYGVTVDMQAGTWTYQRQTMKIGEPIKNFALRTHGIIGVYNSHVSEHRSAMQRDGKIAGADRSPPNEVVFGPKITDLLG